MNVLIFMQKKKLQRFFFTGEYIPLMLGGKNITRVAEARQSMEYSFI